MGLNDNTKNIELALKEKNKLEKQKQYEKALKEAERKRKIEEKENEKQLEIDVISSIKVTFEIAIRNGENLEKYYLNEKYYTLLNNAIREFSRQKDITNLLHDTKKGNIIYIDQYKIKEIFENNYFKILKQKENIIKKQQQILKQQKEEAERKILEELKQAEQERLLQEQEQEQKQKEKKEKELKILKGIAIIILTIFCLPIGFLLLLVFAACKGSK